MYEAGRLLLRTGAIEPEYVQAMKRIIEQYGPYVVIMQAVDKILGLFDKYSWAITSWTVGVVSLYCTMRLTLLQQGLQKSEQYFLQPLDEDGTISNLRLDSSAEALKSYREEIADSFFAIKVGKETDFQELFPSIPTLLF
nr:hypothetical protein [Chloroflexota bacterium]